MFKKIREMVGRIKSLKEDKLLFMVFEDLKLQNHLIELNKKQLSEGKGADFNDLPRYEDDPFFKTQKAAKAYEAWKAKISPNKNKPAGVMDFYIDGSFYETLQFRNEIGGFSITSNSPISKDVQTKTDSKALGISSEILTMVMPDVKSKLIKNVRNQIRI